MGQKVSIEFGSENMVFMCASGKFLECADRESYASPLKLKELETIQFYTNVLDKAFDLENSVPDDCSHLTAIQEEKETDITTSFTTDTNDTSGEITPDDMVMVNFLQSPNYNVRRESHEAILKKELFSLHDSNEQSQDPSLNALYISISSLSDLSETQDLYRNYEQQFPDSYICFANGVTPLHLAVANCNFPASAWLLNEVASSLVAKDSCGRNALHYAYLTGDPQMINLILDHDKDALSAGSCQADRDCYGNRPADLETCSIQERADSSLTSSTVATNYLPLCSPLSDITQSTDAPRPRVTSLDSPADTHRPAGSKRPSRPANINSSPKLGTAHFSRRLRKTASFMLSSVLPPTIYKRKSQRSAAASSDGLVHTVIAIPDTKITPTSAFHRRDSIVLIRPRGLSSMQSEAGQDEHEAGEAAEEEKKEDDKSPHNEMQALQIVVPASN